MAPKQSKVLKDAAVMKKPAGKPDQYDILNQAALLRLEGASDTRIVKWMEDMNDKEGQRLWKNFEQRRLEQGTDKEYRAVTAGPGGKKTARNLLKVYIKGGCSTKSEPFQNVMESIKKMKSSGVTTKWKPLHYMLSQMYGVKELKARCLAGTILVRACPDDPRFPEFAEKVDYSKEETQRVSGVNYKNKAKADWDSFHSLVKIDESNVGKMVFQRGIQDEDDDPLKALGWKNPKDGASGAFDPPVPQKRREETHAESTSSQCLALLENSNALADKGDDKSLRQAIAKAISSIQQLLGHAAEAKEDDRTDKNRSNKLGMAIGELKKTLKLVEKTASKSKTLKKSTVKSVIKKAAAVAKKHAKIISLDADVE